MTLPHRRRPGGPPPSSPPRRQPFPPPHRGCAARYRRRPRMPAAKHRLDAADEASLLVQAAPGDDESPVVRPGLLFQLLQSVRAEMNARGLKEGVGTAYHAPIVQLRATPGDRARVSLSEEPQRSPSRWRGGTAARRVLSPRTSRDLG